MKQFFRIYQHNSIYFFFFFLLSVLNFQAQGAVNKKSQTFAPSGLLCELLSHPELSLITNPTPDFGWIVNSDKPEDFQNAYRIMVASSAELLKNETPDMWNTGTVLSGQSINIIYAGKPLSSNTSYWWKVKTLNKLGGESA